MKRLRHWPLVILVVGMVVVAALVTGAITGLGARSPFIAVGIAFLALAVLVAALAATMLLVISLLPQLRSRSNVV